jgi:hypothetical protein
MGKHYRIFFGSQRVGVDKLPSVFSFPKGNKAQYYTFVAKWLGSLTLNPEVQGKKKFTKLFCSRIGW